MTTASPALPEPASPRELLLNRIQKDIPIVQRPYEVLGQELGLTVVML